MSKFKDICLCILFLSFAALFIVILFTGIFSQRNLSEEYDALSEQYVALETRYNDLQEVHDEMKLYYQYRDDSVVDDLWACEDDVSSLSSYFDGDDAYTFDYVKESFNHFYTVYKKYCHY